MKTLNEAKDFLNNKLQQAGYSSPLALCVLGSGLGAFAEKFENKIEIPYNEIPGFKQTSVSGHAGQLVFIQIKDKTICFQQGRLHAYEGHSYDEINTPLRVLKLLKARTLILTNAAGSLHENLHPGDLVAIKDQINFSGKNPLAGPNLEDIGPRFPDMSEIYSHSLRSKLKSIAEDQEIPLKEGIYFHVLGPSYESPAEIKAFHKLGGDMVGMSTAPEAIAAKHCGYEILGVSCITNYGSGIKDEKLSHDDVKVQATKVIDKFSSLIEKFLLELIKE